MRRFRGGLQCVTHLYRNPGTIMSNSVKRQQKVRKNSKK